MILAYLRMTAAAAITVGIAAGTPYLAQRISLTRAATPTASAPLHALAAVHPSLLAAQAAPPVSFRSEPNDPPRITADKSVKYDYSLVYVRTKRQADAFWANTEPPTKNPPGAELMILYPNGRQEVLVGVQPQESIADPYVSLDGRSVYFVKFHDVSNPHDTDAGADIYRVDVKTRKVVRLTEQNATPNQGAFDAEQHELPQGVYNLGPCPLPGGRIVFTSNRNLYRGVQDHDTALQLFVMDDDGNNVEEIGHLNLGGAMHPVVLKDGRIMFSSAETQGIRTAEQWGLWTIHPDGTNWNGCDPVLRPHLRCSQALRGRLVLGRT